MRPFRAFAVALTFLTRLPIHVAGVQEPELGRSVAFFPLVGIALGLVSGAAERVSRHHVSVELVAVMLVSLLAVFTGGLHLDGLADVFDGIAGSRGNAQRMLEVMKDSRIGALGAAAMVLVLIGKVFLVVDVQRAGSTWSLFVFPAAARWAVTPLVVLFPYARPEGLGKAFHENAAVTHFIVATSIMACIVALAGTRALTPTIAAFFAALAVAVVIQRRLGGLTGDVYGAAIELSEMAFLIIVAGKT